LRTVVKAETPTVTVTEGNEQYCAPWIVQSPGGTVTTSAYNGGKKRCLSAEGGSGDPRKKVSEQNKALTRAHRKNGHRLSKDEIGAEAHKRQKEMRGAARAAEMTEEEVALEKPKGIAEKAAARKASTGQAGTVKRAAEEAAREAATGQAGTVNRAAGDAKRRAATGQAGKNKHAAGEAKRWAATGQADKDEHAGVEAARKAETGQAGTVKRVVEQAARCANKKIRSSVANAMEDEHAAEPGPRAGSMRDGG
jgi:hypothetical protein